MPRVPRPSASPLVLPSKDYASASQATRQLQHEQEDREERHVREAKQQRRKSKAQQRANNELQIPGQREERHETSQIHQWRLDPQPNPLTESLLSGTSHAGIAEAEGTSSRSGPQVSPLSRSPIRWVLPGFVSFRAQGASSGRAQASVLPSTRSSAQACAPASPALPPSPLLDSSSATASPPPRPIASLAESSSPAAATAGLVLSGENSLERLERGGAGGGGEGQYASGGREWWRAEKGAMAGVAGRGAVTGASEGEGDGAGEESVLGRRDWSIPVRKVDEAGRVVEDCEEEGGKERGRKRKGQRRPILRWIWRSASVSSEEREGSAEREEGGEEESEEGSGGSGGSDDESDEREDGEEEREGGEGDGVAEAAAKAVGPLVGTKRAGRGKNKAKTSGLWRKEA
ncbi:hypothetical protein CLOM_g21191, partial [Closterium sp. NIES-68]